MSDPLDRARLTAPHGRSEEVLREIISTLCQTIWNRQVPAGKHLWSIPVDKERDFDCILSDAVTELVQLRASRDDLAGQVARLTEERDEAQLYNRRIGTRLDELEAEAAHMAGEEESHINRRIQAESEVTTLRGEVARLTQALREFGRHDYACANNTMFNKTDCTCGLSAALRGATEARTT